MKWSTAKNYILIALVLLNIFLYLTTNLVETNYTLTSAQEKNIITVLSDSNIGVYKEIPKNFFPMSQLKLLSVGNTYDTFLVELFFDGAAPLMEISDNKTTYSLDDKVLTIQSGYFTFTSSGSDKDAVNTDHIITSLETYYKNILNGNGDFKLERSYSYDDSKIIEYRNFYKGFLIESNFLEIEVTKNNSIRLASGYIAVPLEFAKKSREIISADMALFNFSKEITNTYGTREVFIKAIDLVYYQTEKVDGKDIEVIATPCYRIYIEGLTIPFLINAYTNEFIYETNFTS